MSLLEPKLDPDERSLFSGTVDRIKRVLTEILEQQRGGESSFVEVESTLGQIAREKSIAWNSSVQFQYEVSEGRAPWVRMNSDVLERVVLNLLENSYQAIEACDHRKIHLRLEKSSSLACIVIEDNGPGFSVDLLNDIKSGHFRSTKTDGNGLGLRFAINEVEKAGGHVDLGESQLAGARVVLAFPVQPPLESLEKGSLVSGS